MKKPILIALIGLLIIHACKKTVKSDYILFSGMIENPNSDTLSIQNTQGDLVKSIILNNSNSFSDTLTIPEGYYYIDDGKEGTSLYFSPNSDLTLELNTTEFDESIKYKGSLAAENNYLAEKALLKEQFGKFNYYGYYGKLREEDFIKITDSIFDIQVDLLKSKTGLSSNFAFIESKTLEFNRLERISSYEATNRFVTENEDFNVSKNYPNPFENVDLADERLLKSQSYLGYIESYLRTKTLDKISKTKRKVDYTLEYFKTIKRESKSSLIKEELLFSAGKRYLNHSNKLDSIYAQLIPELSINKYISVITEQYKKLKKIEKGAASPIFKLNDINGNSVSLTDLKGKLVYIDIWATWCLPCTKEIPTLKKMEVHFDGKEVQFVSICMRDTEERWRKMVSKEGLGGVQLFAPSDDIPFFKDYAIQGIPHFVLLDREGNILDSDAKRPSDTTITAEIEGYL